MPAEGSLLRGEHASWNSKHPVRGDHQCPPSGQAGAARRALSLPWASGRAITQRRRHSGPLPGPALWEGGAAQHPVPPSPLPGSSCACLLIRGDARTHAPSRSSSQPAAVRGDRGGGIKCLPPPRCSRSISLGAQRRLRLSRHAPERKGSIRQTPQQGTTPAGPATRLGQDLHGREGPR